MKTFNNRIILFCFLFIAIFILILTFQCNDDNKPLAAYTIWSTSIENSFMDDVIPTTTVNYDFPTGTTKGFAYLDTIYAGMSNYDVFLFEPTSTAPIIEGVVTNNGKLYKKVTFTVAEKNYSCYTIQDKDSGWCVVHDGRVPPAQFGDRIKIKVRGLLKYYAKLVLISDVVEKVASGVPLYVRDLPSGTSPGASHENLVYRIEGTVTSAPTDYNFNSGIIRTPAGISTTFSQDKELAAQNVNININDYIRLTAPIIQNYGYIFTISHEGQIEFISRAN